MRTTAIAIVICRCVPLFAVAAVMCGCASGRHDAARDTFSAAAPFSKTVAGPGDAVCWSVKRALLSQGYMVDRPNDSGVLTGTRDYQPDPKMKQTSSAGIGPATITMPSGSAKILGVVRRETIQDPNFYNHFFALIEQYVAEEQRSHPDGRHAETR